MHRRLTLRLAFGVAMLLMSCSGAPIGSDDSVQNVVSTNSSQSATTLPDTVAARCNRIASQVIEEFVASFNDGGIDLDPYFATGDEFIWFSDDLRGGLGRSTGLYDPRDRSSLIAYLHEVRRTRGPISILSLKFTSHGFKIEAASPDAVRYAVSAGYGGGMELDWGGLRRGKIVVDCGRRQIDMWSLGPAKP